MSPAWPPDISAFRVQLKRDPSDQADNALLQSSLDAAVAFVERIHDGKYNFRGDLVSDLPCVPADMRLGTLRYALRLHHRAQSPLGLVDFGNDLGSARVTTGDRDIDRLLQVGSFVNPVFG